MLKQASQVDLVLLKIVRLELGQDFLVDFERAGNVLIENTFAKSGLVMPPTLIDMAQADLITILEGIELPAIVAKEIGIESAGLLPLPGFFGVFRFLTEEL